MLRENCCLENSWKFTYFPSCNIENEETLNGLFLAVIIVIASI